MGRRLPSAATRHARRGKPQRDRRFAVAIVALPLAAFTAVLLWDGTPAAVALPQAAPGVDREQAGFPLCRGPARTSCVIDGDTLWYRGEKIRIADINAPETSDPQCAREAALGRKATLRLQALLNRGPFSLAPNPDGRATDVYGRSLYVITRNGDSIGAALVGEGLAENWRGYRGSWC
jgi:endonuclease YncB( thermonuclease family)